MIPLSYAQRRMWLTNQIEDKAETYNISPTFRLTGPLDAAAMIAAINDVVDRHETLRTRYVTDENDEPYQQILPAGQSLVEVEVRDVAADDLPAAIKQAIAHHFDLAAEIPLRAHLYRCGPEEHVLLLVIQHISSDGVSGGPLSRDLATAYAARLEDAAPAWAPLEVQYKDYALWQRELLGDVTDPASLAARQADYWRRELDGVPQPLSLPLDRPRPEQRNLHGDTVRVDVAPQAAARLAGLADEHGMTMAMVMQAGLAVLLGALGGGEDITIGGPIAGRTDEALTDLVGFFVNTQVLRVDLSGGPSFVDVLARVREKALTAYEHQDLPFEMLVELINPNRSMAYQPLFQVAFAWQNWARWDYGLVGLQVEFEQHLVEATISDLFLSMAMDDSGKVWGDLMYATQLFDRETAEAIAARFGRVLEQLAADPLAPIGTVDVLLPAERERLLRAVNDTAYAGTAGTLPDAFEAQVRRDPDRVAVIAEQETLTYGELDRRANRLAHWLLAQGAGPEQLVAVRMPRSVELVVAIYAVVKAGAAYVPIDIEAPEDRVRQLLDSSRPLLVLDETLPDVSAYPDSAPQRVLSPDNAAYVIYTSGSTGGPKGVQVPHRSIMNYLKWFLAYFGVTPEDRFLLGSSTSFDASVPELFVMLQMGAAIVVAREGGRREPAYLAELIQKEGVTGAFFVPSLLDAFINEPAAKKCTGLRWMEVIGEAFPAVLANTVTELLPGCDVYNCYGPTETTAGVTAHLHVPGADRVPIGTPIWNTRVYVLDEQLRPVAPGVPGELYLSGAGSARGYLGHTALTSHRFVACPFGEPGARMYRTGDLVRWNRDGALEFIGRTDFQVKLRGIRIELGEIENVLAGHPAVARAAVVARSDERGDAHLVAYAVPDPDAAVVATGDRLEEWRRVRDDKYAEADGAPWGEDFRGQDSSSAGEPIPLEEMREWRDAAVAQVLGFAPRRVLEIGAGSGLLLAGIADSVEEYWGTDISAAAVDGLRRHVDQQAYADRVRLSVQAADDVSGLPRGGFDTVLLNSVVQYFPSAGYLDRVLSQALELLAPGGRVIVGDVRNARTLRLLVTAAQRAAQPQASTEEIRALVEQALLTERELAVAPEWFADWAADHGLGVDIRLKAGQAHNELTRHRYEVVLHQEPVDAVDLVGVPGLRWGREVAGLDALADRLIRAGADPVRVSGIPNARLVAEAVAAASSSASGQTVLSGAPLDPQELAEWARQRGFEPVLTWSGEAPHGFDAVLLPASQAGQQAGQQAGHQAGHQVGWQAVRGGFVPGAAAGRSGTNAPALSAAVGPLAAELPGYLRDRLPGYMVPASVVLLSELPVNAAGKLDRQALPVERVASRGGQPRNVFEEKLCAVFSEVLRVENVGIDDDFFVLGGHSLLAARLSAKIRKQLGVDVPLRTIVRYPTVAELAALTMNGAVLGDHLDPYAPVLPLHDDPGTGKPPVWFLHGGGGLGWVYFSFAPFVQDRPAYALQARGCNGVDPLAESVQDMVADYAEQILRIQPEGPYNLVGWSLSGPLVHALADNLDRRGHEVGLLAVLDATPSPGFKDLPALDPDSYRKEVEDFLSEFMNPENVREMLDIMGRVGANNRSVMKDFDSPVYRGDLLYFHANQGKDWGSYAPSWRDYIQGDIEEFEVDSTHEYMHMPKPAAQVMRVIAPRLA
ncbi:amino acid adenylation domain-containing protein [Catenulispora sp. EB89]|uniref:amino acid adenylation domain-containing protein n=1 Tax=Catenulispora sp. EB89 TaxID=3156257 RepID=UPI0035115D6C